jgi:hypothetical protein
MKRYLFLLIWILQALGLVEVKAQSYIEGKVFFYGQAPRRG